MISSISCCVGWRVTAVQTTRPRAGAARPEASAGVTFRTDSANTKPMASTLAAREASTASGVVMPQILIHSFCRDAVIGRGFDDHCGCGFDDRGDFDGRL